jgi:hypothetical protein
MAHPVNEPKVGQRIYLFGRPQVAGVITAVLGKADNEYFHRVRVKWLKGHEEEYTTHGLNDFDSLIADHRKKLDTHLKTLKKLEAL